MRTVQKGGRKGEGMQTIVPHMCSIKRFFDMWLQKINPAISCPFIYFLEHFLQWKLIDFPPLHCCWQKIIHTFTNSGCLRMDSPALTPTTEKPTIVSRKTKAQRWLFVDWVSFLHSHLSCCPSHLPLMRGIFAGIFGILPLAKPITSRRPASPIQRRHWCAKRNEIHEQR